MKSQIFGYRTGRFVILFALLVALILASLALGACAPVPPGGVPPDGFVEALQPGSTSAGMVRALTGQIDTIVLEKEGMQVLGWSQGNGWGWASLKPAGGGMSLFRALGGKANFASATTFSDLVEFLKEEGWKVTSGPLFKTAEEAAKFIGNHLPNMTILMFPGGAIPPELLQEGPQS